MNEIIVQDGGVFVHGGDALCVACCDAQLVCSSYRTGEWNLVGLNKDGDIYWRFEIPHGRHPRIFGNYIYHCYIGLRKYSLEGNLMAGTIFDGSYDVAVDSSGNVYTCGARLGGKTVRKYNNALVLQWSIDTGDTLSHIALNYDETKIAVGGDFSGSPGWPYTNMWVLNTVDGSEVSRREGAGGNDEPNNAVGWDAGDYVYIASNISYGNPYGTVQKVDLDGNVIWTWTGSQTEYVYGMVVGSSHVFVEKSDGTVLCLTHGIDPANPGEPIEVWSVAGRGGDGIALDVDERLFTMDRTGDLRELDPSNGDVLWTVTNVMDHTLPADGWRYREVDAGHWIFVVSWTNSTLYYQSEVTENDGTIYRSLQPHVSGGDALWVSGGTYTIGDRCYRLNPNDTAYILENNSKGPADTTLPSLDVDWVVDNDEPGVGNHWEDYWEVV